ncbi:MAG: SAM-dependent methyltransferase [Saccharospirillaceae bacterium]|nr:SAM-dependent methyltransferase [Pseudomonadales bacterium]NRB79093.1 SAM-dependent methyltransferase [Saccharospirillaceae bacterium]
MGILIHWTDDEFKFFQILVKEKIGIHLAPHKKALLTSRLNKRLIKLNLESYYAYYKFITNKENAEELKLAIELITTNETYFFREEKHFIFLTEQLALQTSNSDEISIWSAASSYGHEAYSTAMLLDDKCKVNWKILASDVNDKVLTAGRKGIFPNERLELIPDKYFKKYCKKGTGPFDDKIRIVGELRKRIEFRNINLINSFSELGPFDIIFLRNVMIYFDDKTKKDLINRMYDVLKPGGFIFVGHSESLHGFESKLDRIQSAIYQRNYNAD